MHLEKRFLGIDIMRSLATVFCSYIYILTNVTVISYHSSVGN